MNTARVSSSHIRHNLINLSQLVFEVTDDCNLNCYYCAYGDLYNGYDKRMSKYLKFSDIEVLINYLIELWKNNITEAKKPLTIIGFYGGEPLLNMNFIKRIINYIELAHLPRTIEYSMTTNGLLLNKHMKFLIEKKFQLLISLDGNKIAHSYRVDKKGNNSFDRIIRNIRILKNEYTSYFKNNVNFNSVLHDRNNIESIINFIFNEFGKIPQISELNDTGIKESRVVSFKNIYHSKLDDFKDKSLRGNSSIALVDNPFIYDAMMYIKRRSNNVYKYYNDLFIDYKKINFTPTGTCIPFSRKLFITANGKILPCERIHHKFSFGVTKENCLEFDLEKASNNYNALLDKMQPICSLCYNKNCCTQCLYHIYNLDSRIPKCNSFMSKLDYERYQKYCLSIFREKDGLYKRIINDAQVE